MHVGLEYALCSRCMCLIEAFTRCVAFSVPQSTLILSSQVRKESACSCWCCLSARIGLLKTLRLVLRGAVRHSFSSFCRKQDKESMHDTQCIHRLGLFIIPVGLFTRLGLFCARVIFGIHMMRGK